MTRAALHLLIVLELAAAIVALWLGEHVSGLVPWEGLGALLLFAFTVAFAVRKLGTAAMLSGAFGTAALFALVWLAGTNEATLAFNECVTSGEDVRRLLGAHRERTGAFPASLADLGTHLPGSLTLPPSTLRYARTAQGYRLTFRDALVEHDATEREAFLAHK